MKCVILESPYAALPSEGSSDEDKFLSVGRNRRYLQACIRDCLRRGEAPFASHQMYTSALDDDHQADRHLGMEAGFSWVQWGEQSVVYIDRGVSDGMWRGIEKAEHHALYVEFRTVGVMPWAKTFRVTTPEGWVYCSDGYTRRQGEAEALGYELQGAYLGRACNRLLGERLTREFEREEEKKQAEQRAADAREAKRESPVDLARGLLAATPTRGPTTAEDVIAAFDRVMSTPAQQLFRPNRMMVPDALHDELGRPQTTDELHERLVDKLMPPIPPCPVGVVSRSFQGETGGNWHAVEKRTDGTVLRRDVGIPFHQNAAVTLQWPNDWPEAAPSVIVVPNERVKAAVMEGPQGYIRELFRSSAEAGMQLSVGLGFADTVDMALAGYLRENAHTYAAPSTVGVLELIEWLRKKEK